MSVLYRLVKRVNKITVWGCKIQRYFGHLVWNVGIPHSPLALPSNPMIPSLYFLASFWYWPSTKSPVTVPAWVKIVKKHQLIDHKIKDKLKIIEPLCKTNQSGKFHPSIDVKSYDKNKTEDAYTKQSIARQLYLPNILAAVLAFETKAAQDDGERQKWRTYRQRKEYHISFTRRSSQQLEVFSSSKTSVWFDHGVQIWGKSDYHLNSCYGFRQSSSVSWIILGS